MGPEHMAFLMTQQQMMMQLMMTQQMNPLNSSQNMVNRSSASHPLNASGILTPMTDSQMPTGDRGGRNYPMNNLHSSQLKEKMMNPQENLSHIPRHTFNPPNLNATS